MSKNNPIYLNTKAATEAALEAKLGTKNIQTATQDALEAKLGSKDIQTATQDALEAKLGSKDIQTATQDALEAKLGDKTIQAATEAAIFDKAGEPSKSFTRPADTAEYVALDVVGPAITGNLDFADVLPDAGGHFIITGALLRIDVDAVPTGMGAFRLHLYDAAPTAIADNAAFNLIAADRDKYLGYIEFETPLDIGDTLVSTVENVNLKGKLAAASTTLYGVLQTVLGFTPTSGDVKSITLHTIGV